jgi:hypothetical protein
VLFRLIKLWFKLAGMLISALGGVAIGMILTRAGEIIAREDHGQLPAKTEGQSTGGEDEC